jgi:hypothetical protein
VLCDIDDSTQTNQQINKQQTKQQTNSEGGETGNKVETSDRVRLATESFVHFEGQKADDERYLAEGVDYVGHDDMLPINPTREATRTFNNPWQEMLFAERTATKMTMGRIPVNANEPQQPPPPPPPQQQQQQQQRKGGNPPLGQSDPPPSTVDKAPSQVKSGSVVEPTILTAWTDACACVIQTKLSSLLIFFSLFVIMGMMRKEAKPTCTCVPFTCQNRVYEQ